MAERPFQTWSFDNACDTMDWNPDTKVSLVVGDDVDADLVLVGVFAPAKDDDATDTDEEEELGELLLEGKALEPNGAPRASHVPYSVRHGVPRRPPHTPPAAPADASLVLCSREVRGGKRKGIYEA